jgi:hypothetical protein
LELSDWSSDAKLAQELSLSASPAYVMAQMGHTSADLALEVYARKMERKRDTGQRMDALIRGADWAQMGTNAEMVTLPVAASDNKNPA